MKKSKTTAALPDCWKAWEVKRSFNTFTPLDSNRLALSHAEAAAKRLGNRGSNPLLLCSEVNGLGATHLLEAIAFAYKECGMNVIFMSAERFAIWVQEACADQSVDAFLRGLSSADALLIDDIQFLCAPDRPAYLNELKKVLASFLAHGKQIVMTTDESGYNESAALLENLPTLHVARLFRPNAEEKMKLLVAIAESEGVAILADVNGYLANLSTNNIRALIGHYKRVIAYASRNQKPISMEWVPNLLEGKLLPE